MSPKLIHSMTREFPTHSQCLMARATMLTMAHPGGKELSGGRLALPCLIDNNGLKWIGWKTEREREKRIKAIHSFIREEDRAMDGQLTARALTFGWSCEIALVFPLCTSKLRRTNLGLAMKI